jgi:hypothetical protein
METDLLSLALSSTKRGGEGKYNVRWISIKMAPRMGLGSRAQLPDGISDFRI